MKIYILTDLEGVNGVVHPDQTDIIGPGYEKAREWLTLEVNAAVQGAVDGGATEVLVVDGHGMNNACNMVYDKLHKAATYIQGSPWSEYLQSLDSSFDGMFQIGAHAMAGTPAAVLEHTMSAASWVEMRLNGKPTGEIGLIAAIAGQFGVPFVMVSGDDKACAESAALVPDVECAVVKRGISRHCADMLSMNDAHALIREKARQSMRKLKIIKPVVVDSPVEIEVFYLRTHEVDAIIEREGVRKIDSRKVVYTGKNVIEAFDHVRGK
ncbi:MAG TPA: M55 family metallopeptidase [Armatimonadota bacterium]|jgi:D-amino peptidase